MAPTLGLALGSGSVHGLAHVGVIRAVMRRRLPVRIVCGTSAGAVAGIMFAAGLDAAAIEAHARRIDWRSAASMVFPWLGLMSNEALGQTIDEIVGRRPIESLPLRFAAVAADIRDGARVLLDRGPAGLAVGASAAIPVLFQPVTIDGRELVDGSLVEPVPVRAARELGAGFVIAVDVAFRPSEEPPAGLAGIAFQMMHVMINALIDEQIGDAAFALRMNLHRLMMHDEHPASVLIDAGERAFDEAWPELARRLAGAGIRVGSR